jgi:hypothetical protein
LLNLEASSVLKSCSNSSSLNYLASKVLAMHPNSNSISFSSGKAAVLRRHPLAATLKTQGSNNNQTSKLNQVRNQ